MEVPFLDLRRQYAQIRGEVESAIHRVCESQQFILGREVEDFENEIAPYLNVRHAIGVSSGTDALLVSLMALGVEPGDEIVTSPFTFFATAGAIARLGAKPVFVDVRPDTFNIDSNLVERALTKRTKGIIPVHLFGYPSEMKPLMELAKSRGLFVLEDVAQAIGAKYGEKLVGCFGNAACYSFFPAKNLGAFGDAGLVTTEDDALAKRVRELRVHGGLARYEHQFVGGNFRIDALQAAILRVKLPHLDGWVEARRKNASLYRTDFEKLGLAGPSSLEPPLKLPFESPENFHVYNQYVIRAKDRDGLLKHLREKQVATAVYYPLPLHLQPCFSSLGYKRGELPVSEALCSEVLALPIYPDLTAREQQYIVNSVREFYR